LRGKRRDEAVFEEGRKKLPRVIIVSLDLIREEVLLSALRKQVDGSWALGDMQNCESK